MTSSILAHIPGALPFLILLACPLLHFFMHGGHGTHSGHGAHADPQSGARSAAGNAP